SELGDVLELALGGRVVDGHQRIVDEAEEGSLVVEVVVDRRRQRLGGKECGSDSDEPSLEVFDERTDALLPVLAKRVAMQAEMSRRLLLAVHGADERAAFGREHRLSRFGVAELASPVRVAASLVNLARREDAVEAVFGVGRERAPEWAKLGGDDVAVLRGFVLEDRELI